MTLHIWNDILKPPLPERTPKPRSTGVTMVLDKGLGLAEAKDWLAVTLDYVDLIKLTFGTSALYPEELLLSKISLLRSLGIGVFPGGTLLEIAIFQGKIKPFIERAFQLGFNYLEISDGAIPMDLRTRGRVIELAVQHQFKVITEIGKKNPQENLNTQVMLQIAKFDLDHGAEMVIVEGRESGKGVGLYDIQGLIEESRLEYLVNNIPADKLIFEAPLKSQQVEFIKRFGSNVNLGNIAPSEVIALESLRRGLRADTLSFALQTAKKALTI